MATRKVLLAPTSLFVALSIALTFMVHPVADAATKKTLKLLWSDEFNGKKGSLPSSKTWSREIGGGGWGNSERQYYTDKAANASMDGSGRLVITANRISNEYAEQIGEVPGTEDILNRCSECQFTSARMKTARNLSFQYGRIEARIKMPQGVGTWPALWLMPVENKFGHWPRSGEIDLMEHVGRDLDTLFFCLHTEDYNHTKDTDYKKVIHIPGLTDDFHKFGLEWKEGSITYFLDDKEMVKYTKGEDGKTTSPSGWPFDEHFYLIINLAIGGKFGGEVDPSCLPQEFIVKDIKIYK